MLRQTRDMPGDLFIDVRYPNIREWVWARNVDAQDDPERLLCPSDPKREPRAFRLHRDGKMGRKAGKERPADGAAVAGLYLLATSVGPMASSCSPKTT